MFDANDNLNSEIINDSNLVFIDSQIDAFSTLVSGVTESEVIVLDSTRDGIAQITEALSQRQDISSLQIISHGDIGSLQLGTTNLNSDNIDRYAEELQQWSQHLTTDADILLYGCQVAAEATGQEFIQGLSESTTADVAASNDLTGSLELGGDWDLEITTGEIETELNLDKATQESYQSLLAIPEADNNLFHYSGRVDWQEPQAPAFSYPGTSVEFKFTGTSLKVKLTEDNRGGENYVDVYLDDNPEPTTIYLQASEQPVIYDVAQGLEDTVHKALLVKRNDYETGEFQFHGVVLDDAGSLVPLDFESDRKIEVYGDSIAAGKAVEYELTGTQDPPGDNYNLSNAYYSFGSILARDYNAEISLVAQAGASLVDGYGYWNEKTGAEAFYDRSKPLDNAPLWNFNNYQPDLVVIALGQNDYSTISLNEDLTSQQWQDRYKQFLANLRDKYPNSYFVGMFPNMYHDRQWDNLLTKAVAEYSTEANDNRVFALITEQVTLGHPRLSEQQAMADALKGLIERTLTDNGFHWDVAD